jgi:hypothetical protein
MDSNKQYDYEKAFNSIDDWSYGFVDRKNLKSFLRKHGKLASTEEVIAIIRRMDLDGDARLSKYEFIEGLKPEEPYSKMMKRGELNKSQSKSCLKGVNSSFHHTRRSSHNGALNTSHFNYNNEEDLFNRDPIRT